MSKNVQINTVLGKKIVSDDTVSLSHEHICCYSEYLAMMSKRYLDKNELTQKAVEVLVDMKKKYGVGLFVDCTTVNIGRDIELLKNVSRLSGVDIVCSTGFYYGEEPVLGATTAEELADFMLEDAQNICAGVIKAAVERENLEEHNVRFLKAAAIAQKKTDLPIVLHTNANNRNGLKALEILLGENVSPDRIAVGHLSDTADTEYIKGFAKMGCYVALDRMYDDKSDEYICAKVNQIRSLCDAGCDDRILLSHDDALFQGFAPNPHIKEPRFSYMFEHILPALDADTAQKIVARNVISLLCGAKQ